MKAPPHGVMRLFHRKSVINSKNCFLNRFFARNLHNPGLNRQKQQNLRLFTNKCTRNKPLLFFTFMSRASDINSNRWSFDCQSGIAFDFTRIKKRCAVAKFFDRYKDSNLSALYFILVMLEYIYSTRGVYLLYSQTVGYIYPTSRLYIIDSINIRIAE